MGLAKVYASKVACKCASYVQILACYVLILARYALILAS